MNNFLKKMAIMIGICGSTTVSFAQVSANVPLPPERPFNLCTGPSGWNYERAGHFVKKFSSVRVEVINSKGSIDNLDKIVSGECDGGFVQSDSLYVYSSKNSKAVSSLERGGILYKELVHLVCNNKSGINRITDLTKGHTIAVGSDGSGARTTWSAFVQADKKRYESVGIDSRSGIRAANAVAEGTEVQCAMFISAINSQFVKNDVQSNSGSVILTNADDWDMGKIKDPRGRTIYSYEDIPQGTYPKIQPGGILYGTKPVKTIAVDAIFVANIDWISNNEIRYSKILQAFNRAKPDITNMIAPKN